MMNTLELRFWAKVNKTETCWLWTAMVEGQRYGRLRLGGTKVLAHRLSYEFAFGPIPKGLEVCHRCDNDACVRPDHLFLGTHQDNMQDASRKGRIARGERVSTAKLTSDDVAEMRRLRTEGMTTVALGRKYGVNSATVSRTVRGLRWSHEVIHD